MNTWSLHYRRFQPGNSRWNISRFRCSALDFPLGGLNRQFIWRVSQHLSLVARRKERQITRSIGKAKTFKNTYRPRVRDATYTEKRVHNKLLKAHPALNENLSPGPQYEFRKNGVTYGTFSVCVKSWTLAQMITPALLGLESIRGNWRHNAKVAQQRPPLQNGWAKIWCNTMNGVLFTVVTAVYGPVRHGHIMILPYCCRAFLSRWWQTDDSYFIAPKLSLLWSLYYKINIPILQSS